MIGTGTAILGAAALGLGGSLYASSQAKEAAGVQGQASTTGALAQIQSLLMAQGFTRENAEKAAASITGALPNSLSALTGAAPGVEAAIGGGRAGAITALTGGRDRAVNALALARDASGTELRPFIDTGRKATNTLAELYGLNNGGQVPANALEMVRNSPDYQFAQTEGMRALESSNAAKGLLHSSGHLRGALQFGQGLATNQFGNYVARLGALAGTGLSAAGTLTSANMATGSGIAGLESGTGQGVAGIETGSGNALAQYLQSLGINVSQLFQNQGNALANVWTGQGNALANNAGQIGAAANAGITGTGAANAAGIVGGANAVSSGLTGLSNSANSFMNYNLMQQLMANRVAPGMTYPGQTGWGSGIAGDMTYPVIG